MRCVMKKGMLMVKHTPKSEQSGEGKRRNAGGRDGEMKEERRKGNGEKWRKRKQKRKDRKKRRRQGGSKGWSWWRWCKEGSKQHTEKDKRGGKGKTDGKVGERKKGKEREREK